MRSTPHLRAGLVAVALALLLPVPAHSQEGVLGRTEFPNSGPAEAQAPFLEGVLWMHSFEYSRARNAFREAQRIAPDFVMAYWGEAMTWNHPVWFAQYREQAREVVERLGSSRESRLARAGTEREQAWLESLEILYGDGPKAWRDTLYSEALGRMWERWPADENVGAFYACRSSEPATADVTYPPTCARRRSLKRSTCATASTRGYSTT
jgi:hypothetical protein